MRAGEIANADVLIDNFKLVIFDHFGTVGQLERFFGLEPFVELIAFCDQGISVFCPRCSAREAKHRTKQPESAKEMIRIHECK